MSQVQPEATPAAAAPAATNTWSTGMFEVTKDLEVFLFSIIACPCVAVENKLSVMKEELPVKEEGFLAQMGCVHGDTNRCCSLCLLGCCPCVYIVWRKQIREKYGINGGCFPDCIALCCCAPLAVMQDARHIKAHTH